MWAFNVCKTYFPFWFWWSSVYPPKILCLISLWFVILLALSYNFLFEYSTHFITVLHLLCETCFCSYERYQSAGFCSGTCWRHRSHGHQLWPRDLQVAPFEFVIYSFVAKGLYFGCFFNLLCKGAGVYASYFGLIGRHCGAITVFACGMSGEYGFVIFLWVVVHCSLPLVYRFLAVSPT